MSRSLVTLRSAGRGDAALLAQLWSDGLRRVDATEQTADVEQIIKDAANSAEQRVVVAEYGGELAGAVLLRVSTISPINLEPTVQAVAPQVFPQYRRHGIGRLLMESAVAYAEEIGVLHLSTAALAGSRDGNRFLARLAFGPQATLRLAPAAAVRARLNAQRPVVASGNPGQVTRVLAARRSLRRSRATG